ncbi:MAG TPA: FtsQ-type POTRA domain-containing protein [Granulicella sp.]|nr:FtsQ-type POTRA domain-containing protein [Granulicella sp.]
MIDAPEEMYAPERDTPPPRRRSQRAQADSRPEKQQRDFGQEFEQDHAASSSNSPFASPSNSDDEDFYPSRRSAGGVRLRLRGNLLRIPRTLWGRILGGVLLLALLGGIAASYLLARSFFLHDERFVLASSSSIQIVGNTHVTRAQLLDIFGQDLERNIFNISLAARRRELEQLPWVEHASVMRLLPDHLRIAITERTPVAFVRQGTQIGLVDAAGVLLDIPANAPGDPTYSFPVLTGVNASDPLSTRAARMKIYTRFTSELDSTGQQISAKLSEIDLSDPEDVKALIPEGWADILVHFGDSEFLSRYQKFQQLLPEWRTQYPKLGSVDMRYDRQVVLEMQPGAAASAPGDTNAGTPAAPAESAAKPSTTASAKKLPAKPKSGTKPLKKAHPASIKPTAGWRPGTAPPHPNAAVANASPTTPATTVKPGAPHPALQAGHP